MTAKTDKAGAFAFNYNARNDLTDITDPFSGFRVQAFNAAGQLTHVTQGTTLRTFGFDNAGRLASDELKNWSSNAVLNLETYGYNADDNLTSETNSGNGRIGSHTYTYDKAERIASWTASTGTTA
jgi:large repetitive protein